MLAKTANAYRIRYIQTGISGKGIEKVYLPPRPKDSEIKDLNGIWKRLDIPDHVLPHYEKYCKDKSYSHPILEKYVKEQWTMRYDGMWFWNTVHGQREAVYITGLHWFYLQWWFTNWETNDGYPVFLDVDKEIFYILEYIEQDSSCYGTLLGMMRRGGKSAKMGVWLTEYCMRVNKANGGIQGETQNEAKDFYDEHILDQFRSIPAFFMPETDTSSKMVSGITFKTPVVTGKNANNMSLGSSLRGWIAYGPTKKNRFNKSKLKRYVIEEGAKITELDVYELHSAMKESVRLMSIGEGTGKKISGKFFYASTADDEADVTESFTKMWYDSDFDIRGTTGQTKSGLYAVFVPSQYVISVDRYGIPRTDENLKTLEDELSMYDDDPIQYANTCKRNPRNMDEYFYVNANKCQFNVKVLQARKTQLNMMPNITERYSLEFVDGKVVATPNPAGHHFFSWLPQPKELNRVRDTGRNGYERYEPLAMDDYCMGHDPVMFGKIKSNRRSNPVAYALRKYKEEIDGPFERERMIMNAAIKYEYQTGIPFHMYKNRTDDPQVYFEEIVKVLHLLGCQINIERQHGSAITEYIKMRGYYKFIFQKSKDGISINENQFEQETTDGTDASKKNTHHYATLIATWVNNFGHCNAFKDLNNDLLAFDPSDTLKFDHASAFGFTLIAAAQPIKQQVQPVDIADLFPVYSAKGNTASLVRR